MPGPQFFHLQSYAQKANQAGQSVEQVLSEAARDPRFSQHVASPQPYRVILGLSPESVQQRHDQMVAAGGVQVSLKDGKTARRGIRKDRHTLLTAVASHPHLTAQVEADPLMRAEYEVWVDRNVRFLRDLFGDRLVSVVEHVDEEHPHIHAFILPLHDPACSARDLNPAWVAKSEAETAARAAGDDDRAAVKIGNLAYRQRARELQDQYHLAVGLLSGLTRTGPKRERLSRAQWQARKDEAMRQAEISRQTDERLVRMIDAEAAVEAAAEQKAEELADQFDAADRFLAEAAMLKARAEDRVAEAAEAWGRAKAEAQTIILSAKREAVEIKSRAQQEAERLRCQIETSNAAARQEAEALRAQAVQKLQSATNDVDLLKLRTAKEVARIAMRVVLGVLTGAVRLRRDESGFDLKDPQLRRRIEDLHIGQPLLEAVRSFARIWGALTQLLPVADQTQVRADVAQELDAFENDTGFPSRTRQGYEP